MGYEVMMKVWVDDPEKDDGSVGGYSIVHIRDVNGRVIPTGSQEERDVLSILHPRSY